ncbi:MAG: DUF4854 domain-containing protein [Lachnospiraceae bacterium]|nr:DUF4854 domain-containing protein [Lachnospiraceae bacterium]
MKRKILMMLMTFTMADAMLAGCSKDDPETSKKDSNATEKVTNEATENDTSEDAVPAEKTLTDYFAEPGVKESMDSDMASVKATYASTYSDISYEIDGNTLVYIYVFKDTIPEDSIEEIQKSADAELSKSVKDQNLIGLIEQQSGVKGVSVRYIYRNPDGTEVFNGTYSE